MPKPLTPADRENVVQMLSAAIDGTDSLDTLMQAAAVLTAADKGVHDLALWHATALFEQFERLAPSLPRKHQLHAHQALTVTQQMVTWLRQIRP